jgi:beta-lactamase superfamily II metal-dependent hydrolase
MSNNLEIDFLPVGNGEKSGDSISFRYGDFSDKRNQYIVVIDGGTIESGDALVKHIKDFYGSYVDLAILTHPDGDHSSGLRQVLNELSVGELWIHKPWEHSKEILDLFVDGRITSNSLSEKLKEGYNYAYEIEQIAISKGITIKEPFAGLTFNNGVIKIIGPTESYYESLIPEFTKTPQQKTQMQKAYFGIKEAVNWIAETLDFETLSEDGETSAENNSSCISLLSFDGEKFLFTGDSGIQGMQNAIDYTKSKSIDLTNINFLQVPHHGSHRNVSPSILNQIKCQTAFVSAAKDAPKHPSKKVVNALIRRGANVYVTNGVQICHNRNYPLRAGYSNAVPIPFFNQVEE